MSKKNIVKVNINYGMQCSGPIEDIFTNREIELNFLNRLNELMIQFRHLHNHEDFVLPVPFINYEPASATGMFSIELQFPIDHSYLGGYPYGQLEFLLHEISSICKEFLLFENATWVVDTSHMSVPWVMALDDNILLKRKDALTLPVDLTNVKNIPNLENVQALILVGEPRQVRRLARITSKIIRDFTSVYGWYYQLQHVPLTRHVEAFVLVDDEWTCLEIQGENDLNILVKASMIEKGGELYQPLPYHGEPMVFYKDTEIFTLVTVTE